ncbi:hypothetical protein CA831_29710, partial [Burkholderia multivorans]
MRQGTQGRTRASWRAEAGQRVGSGPSVREAKWAGAGRSESERGEAGEADEADEADETDGADGA